MDLNRLRGKIDTYDEEILNLLNKRMDVVKEIGEMKKRHNAIVYRPEREKSIIDRLSQLSNGTLNREAIEAIFLEIFAASRNIELPERVAFLGPEGSFTHQAAESRFGAMSDYLSLTTIKAVFDSVEHQRVRFGVVPIENNQEGSVAHTVDLLCERDVKIVAEIPMAINFTFASRENNIHNIEVIYSKDIAFRQCKKFIDEHFDDNIRLVEVTSTSKAAKLANEKSNAAAICSHIAAQLYRVPILFQNIEDTSTNKTRFLILSKNFLNEPSGQDKTTIVAKISDGPGALANFLMEFKQANVNLTKLESKPAKLGGEFKYWFLIDFNGHYKDENVKMLLDKYKNQVLFLGSYVKLT